MITGPPLDATSTGVGTDAEQPHASVGVVRLATGMRYGESQNASLSTFKLQLNGQDRFATQNAKYFNQVQPFYHHSGNCTPGVYAYSFALQPERHQPSGTCNFSRIDNATAVITCKTVGGGIAGADSLEMFATNYNVLRVMDGMGGLAYSN